ncbi:MAG: type II toxin-antitoxin system RelE/ParE family toxin [Nanoarchaeota archaeon]|nr:type II toxin-antitoxin system RelE/ParE family toxin [Nanoarchaeota archaeon]MBU4086353.1 type II toxin-antitoxin system RelE/ParE family toxin [Nanoarchaeota archaeon]
MYSVEFSLTAEKQFCKLPEEIKERIINVLERIKIRPYHFVKRKEGTPYFIARIGEHRAILDIRNEQLRIIVVGIGHRKNIYD